MPSTDPVDPHVAVDEQDGVRITESVGAERETSFEPFVGLGNAVVVGTDPSVDDAGGVFSNELRVAQFETGVEHVCDPGLLPPFELKDRLIRVLVEIAADNDAICNGTQAAVPLRHVGVAVHRGVHCAASSVRIVPSSTGPRKGAMFRPETVQPPRLISDQGPDFFGPVT
jgi:hypothetical protein